MEENIYDGLWMNLMKRRLNSRYKVAVPFAYSMATHFPDFLREYIMIKR